MNEEKFTGKADLYAKYRPSYPSELIDWLYDNIKAKTVADVGAGTGKFTRCLAAKPWKITAVEPNEDMRSKLNIEGVKAVNGTAENTGLENGSVDLVTVAQAFHWFDEEKFKAECKRILKPDGKAAIVFNERNYEDCEISAERDKICQKYCGAFHSGHMGKRTSEEGDIFLKNEYFSEVEFFSAENNITMDMESFIGDTLSRSYALKKTDSGFSYFVEDLKSVFSRYEEKGIVTVKYTANCYLGKF